MLSNFQCWECIAHCAHRVVLRSPAILTKKFRSNFAHCRRHFCWITWNKMKLVMPSFFDVQSFLQQNYNNESSKFFKSFTLLYCTLKILDIFVLNLCNWLFDLSSPVLFSFVHSKHQTFFSSFSQFSKITSKISIKPGGGNQVVFRSSLLRKNVPVNEVFPNTLQCSKSYFMSFSLSYLKQANFQQCGRRIKTLNIIVSMAW